MLNYINNNYEKIEDICRIYTAKKDQYVIDDLMGSLIETFIDKNYNINDEDKFFYLIRVIINMVNNKTNKHNKLFNQEKYIEDVYLIDGGFKFESDVSIFNTIYDFKIDEKVDMVRKLVDELFKTKKITLVEKNSFLFYYFPEEKLNIKNM